MFIFVINPVAGSGKAMKVFEELRETTIYQKIKKFTYFTKYHGHAEQLISELPFNHDIKGIEGVVIIGGDGTIHEVINGLGNLKLPLTYIPGGSGNDFARSRSIMQQPEQILHDLIEKRSCTPYWLGSYQIDQQKTIRMFANCLGIGLDAAVAKRANQSPLKKICNKLHIGKLVYVISLIQELISFTPVSITVNLDGNPYHFHKCLLMSVNNQPYFGGGMKINPYAVNNEEKLFILIVDSISKWKVLTLFGTVFTGRHLTFKEVHLLEGKEMTITSDKQFRFHADGEASEESKLVISKQPDPIKITGITILNDNKKHQNKEKSSV